MQNLRASMRRGALGTCENAVWQVGHRQAVTLLSAIAVAVGVAALPTAGAAQAPGARSHRGDPGARAALSETYVKEEATLHSAKSGGVRLIEQGSGHGTFSAGIQIDLTIGSKVSGSFVAYLKGGSISGYASATPHFSGKYVSFKGSLTIKRGTGKYSGSSGTAGLYGAVNRETGVLKVQVVGRLRL